MVLNIWKNIWEGIFCMCFQNICKTYVTISPLYVNIACSHVFERFCGLFRYIFNHFLEINHSLLSFIWLRVLNTLRLGLFTWTKWQSLHLVKNESKLETSVCRHRKYKIRCHIILMIINIILIKENELKLIWNT